MKKKRFSTEQITAVLHQAEQGIPVGDLCRQVGISEQGRLGAAAEAAVAARDGGASRATASGGGSQ